MVGDALVSRWGLGKSRNKFQGKFWEGRTQLFGPRIALLLPQTYMNASGDAAGPARSWLKVPLDHVVVVHDEIDLSFGQIQTRLGGGLAGHNGLKSLKRGFGDTNFWRVRAGVGRPLSTDPEVVSAWVLGHFTEPKAHVNKLIADAVEETERLVERIA